MSPTDDLRLMLMTPPPLRGTSPASRGEKRVSRQALSANNSRPISMRRISLVPAPIS
jgi:hypothetical protein